MGNDKIPTVYIAGRATDQADACCEESWGESCSKSLECVSKVEEICILGGYTVRSMPTKGGYYLDLTGNFPELRHTIRFSAQLRAGSFTITALGGGRRLAHMHVTNHMDRPYGTTQAVADIFDFTNGRQYSCTVGFSVLLGPGAYSVRSYEWDLVSTMIIDWGWRHLSPTQVIP